ncbi:TetR/AcrR family transcriptional regulator [Prevotella dentasini]|uniref:TetR/AcrR family transcriptional regulator n=1 Tax=Prevotella dentasini TaxID=589537 RepID=UPI00046AF809|nr:TetR/AcrR family transcriptional regulator [Prevotella dentasini]
MNNKTKIEKPSRKEIVLQEAFKLFLAKGYSAVTFADLVAATNVSRGDMFHHFKNKEDIFIKVADRFVFEFLKDKEDFRSDESETPLKEFLDSWLTRVEIRMRSFFRETAGKVTAANFMGFILYLKDNYPSWDEKFAIYMRQEKEVWKRHIEQAKKCGEISPEADSEKVFSAFYNSYVGLSYKTSLLGALSIAELRDSVAFIYNLIKR